MAFICPLCREGFRDKETLENHAMAVHGVNAEGLQRLMMLMQGSHWLNNANKEDTEGRDSGELSAQYTHNSDLRDFHKYIHKQVWGAQIFTRQSSRRFGLVRTWLTEACSIVFYDSAHTTY